MADRASDITLTADQDVATGDVKYRITHESHWDITDTELQDLRSNAGSQVAFNSYVSGLGGATATWYATLTTDEKAAVRARVLKQLPA